MFSMIGKAMTHNNTNDSNKLKAIIFDWAGTVIDFGSLAPMGAFVQLFARYGVTITIAEARIPMGLAKWDHIKALGTQPRISEAWVAARGAPFSDADVDELYDVFIPMNVESAKRHATLIDGVPALMNTLRERGLAIGSTTGYNRAIMDVIRPLAAEQGFVPDSLVCAGDVSEGRPSPLMMYQSFVDLGVWPAAQIVKVDDTTPGIAEGLHAGTWTVGISVSGNEVGIAHDAWQALSQSEQNDARQHATNVLQAAGADYVIDTVAELPAVLDVIEQRLARGERPKNID
jgi:phosphonoacetaldehyde hydrolase